MKIIFSQIVFAFLLLCSAKAQNINYKYQQNRSFTVDEVTEAYRILQKGYPKLCSLQEIGISDIGRPIHLFVISEDGNFNPEAAKKTENSSFLSTMAFMQANLPGWMHL